jgi:8-oxo-dGTP pyrophosphatase MutT (NUDIX family)
LARIGVSGLTKDHVHPPRLSAGVVVVRQSPRARRFLLLRAFRHWDFPKGSVEPGEDPLAAAIREVEEESGLTDLAFRWGPLHLETGPYARGKIARYYVAESRAGEVTLRISPELGRPEHHEFRWLDYSAARALLVPRLQWILDWARSVTEGAPGSPA